MALIENIKKQKEFESVGFETETQVVDHLRSLDVHPRVVDLLKIPQWAQRTPEWFEQRRGKLTASDLDAVCGSSKYQSRTDILFKKCGVAPPFTGCTATRHGQKYEDEAIGHYCRLRGKRVFDFGLLPHPEIPFLAGSPDGITWDGIVLEVKCPFRRKIVMGEIPDHYRGQMFINMEIAGLDHGVFIEYIPECISPTGEMQLNIVDVHRDPGWFSEISPKIHDFHEELERYKKIGIESHPDYEKHYLRANPVVTCHSEPDDFDPEKNVFND